MSINPQPDRSEGDVNLGPRRARWMADMLGPKSRALVDRDAGAFLRQSMSTPCLSAIRRAEGIWIEDMDGRRFMDFHGNSVHHIGYGHPRLVAALGDCALGCGVLGTGAQLAGPLDQILPVDIRIPGCPPTPATIAEHLLEAMVGAARR